MAEAESIEDKDQREALKMTSAIYRENKKVRFFCYIFFDLAMKGGEFLPGVICTIF